MDYRSVLASRSSMVGSEYRIEPVNNNNDDDDDAVLASRSSMVGSEYRIEPVNNNDDDDDDSMSILASMGVEFLLSSEGEIVPLSTLDEQRTTIFLFFSANWCRPCKAFTPQLVHLYNTIRIKDINSIQIIYVSLDKDENGFQQYFKSMPWLAIPFEGNSRNRLRERYNVNRIPLLIPLSNLDGALEENMVNLIEDYGIDAFPFTRKRKEELKAIDYSRRHGGKLLEDLMKYGGLDYVVAGDGRKEPILELVGKTIGLYFGAQWCPPCRAFTEQLTDAYNELNTTLNTRFEIVFVSTDRNQEEFDHNMNTMPWLAIPYHNKSRNDLCRIFDIKGIPALVIVGTDGKILSTNGRAMISSFGARAFPFTASRITEVEAELWKEGEGLAQEVQDLKHEHILKLDMAKAYVCNVCKNRGRFWVFSCDLCDFDLHPQCVEEI